MFRLTFSAILPLTTFFTLPCRGAAQPVSPAETRIVQAQKSVDKNPRHPQPYNELAAGFLERARETGDPSYLEKALQTLDESFALEKDNFEGQRVMAGILLSRHEFGRALEIAQALHQRNRDDLIVWGQIADAQMALGRYADAEKSAQWMLDLRPGDARSLERGARMRDLAGNLEGSLQLWKLAFQAVGDTDSEQRAFLLTGYAETYLSEGKPVEAEALLTQALQLFPGYHLALTGLAKVRMAQHRYPEAIELLRKKIRPTVADKYLLAESLEKSGQHESAASAYAIFEREARATSEMPDNANRELVFYYASHGKTAEAVRIARLQASRRQDIQTLDALAWALHRSGDKAEARKQIGKAVAVGTHDVEIAAHAREIGVEP